MQMRALRQFPGPYMGRVIRAGDEFTAANKRDAHVFVSIGHAAPIVEPGYATRAMTPAAPNIDAMDVVALRAMVERLGLKVHHKAGAHKLREAIRKAV